ncbi:MAG: hypothetical protein NVSMB18_09960 [Acetobacteraceae bacterium]
MDWRAKSVSEDWFSSVDDYVNSAENIETSDPRYELDLKFVNWITPVFLCLDGYANRMNDARLYFLRSSAFIEHLVIALKETEEEARGDSQLGQLGRGLLVELNRILVSQRVEQGSGPPPCEDTKFSPAVKPLRNGSPYPAMLASYSLAAVGSPEFAVLNLSDWVRQQTRRTANLPSSTRTRWLLLRARFAISQLAAQDIRQNIPARNFIAFQRSVTDELRDLISFTSSDWKAFCDEIAGGSIHARLARILAFQYASERSYLFGLEEPSLVQRWRREGSSDFMLVRADLEEAQAFVANPDCFKDVPNFIGKPGRKAHWLGQFTLDNAQLRLGLAASLTGRDGEAEAAQIRAALAQAAFLLGRPTDLKPETSENGPADVLLEADEFEEQRARLARLQAQLPD